MKLINALLVLVIFVASSSMCLPDHALLLPNLFKEAIKLKDYGISERDIIHYCSKANAEDIINYIFRDVGNIDSDEARVEKLNMVLSFKEVQKELEADNAAVLRNRRFLTDPFHYEDLNIGIMPHRVLDSLQAAVDAIGQHGNLALLRNLLENDLLPKVNIPFEAAFIAAEIGDIDMVDWILKRAEIGMHRFNNHILGGRLYDEYIYNVFEGSISGEQFGVFQRVLNRHIFGI